MSAPKPSRSIFPASDWISGYSAASLRDDLIGGIVVSFVTVPQVIAYAYLAGLPAEMGLYAAIIAMIAYALIGTNRTLAVGPTAIVSMMTLQSISELAAPGSTEYVEIAIRLTMLTGLILIGLRIVNFGSLVNFLSHAVVTGFISAAGLLIIMNQAADLLGLPDPGGTGFVQVAVYVADSITQVSPATLWFSLVSLMLLIGITFFLEKPLLRLGFSQRFASLGQKSSPMVVVLLSMLVVWYFPVFGQIEVVGVISGKLPSAMPLITDFGWVPQLFPSAFLIAMVVFVESSSIGAAVASRRRERVQHNQELVALGGANVAVSLFGGFPVAGSFGRTMVNFSAGSATQAASLITALCVVLTMLWFGEAFEYLPVCVLAAIIVMAVRALIDLRAIRRLLTFNGEDAATFLVTFGAVLLGGVETGIMIGVVVSFMLLIRSSSRPHIAIVGRVEGSEHFRNVLRHNVKTASNLMMMRIDESLYFVNARYIENFILKQVARNPELKQLLLICNAVNFVDASGLEMLENLNSNLFESGVVLHLAEVKGPVMDRLGDTEFCRGMHGEIFFTTDIAARELASI